MCGVFFGVCCGFCVVRQLLEGEAALVRKFPNVVRSIDAFASYMAQPNLQPVKYLPSRTSLHFAALGGDPTAVRLLATWAPMLLEQTVTPLVDECHPLAVSDQPSLMTPFSFHLF